MQFTGADELLARRYGEAIAAARPVPEAVAGLLAHRSVRAFLPDSLPEGTLEILVAAAQSASSSSNLQAWSVVAVQDPARKARLAECAGGQEHIRQAPLFLVWLADLSRLHRISQRLGKPDHGLDYLESLLVAVIDAALAAQNALVAAEALGLGAVYIGAMRNLPEAVAAELELPPRAFAAFGLCIGRPDPAHPAAVKPRLPQSAVLHRERYSAAAEEPAIDRYDRIAQDFQRSQNMNPVPWSAQSNARVRGPERLSGRDRLAEALHKLGFAFQ